jgi:hypothetical protein
LIGAISTTSLKDCSKIIDEWAEEALKINPDIIILCHGGPIASPEDAQVISYRIILIIILLLLFFFFLFSVKLILNSKY